MQTKVGIQINPVVSVSSVHRDPAVGLRSLYEFVRSSLSSCDGGEMGEDGQEGWGPPVLLVDDLSVLLSLGVSVGSVLDFSHYCRATVCSQLQVRVSLSKQDCVTMYIMNCKGV